MTRKEIDALWQRAMRESIEAGELYTRYKFAKLVADAEREACAMVCDNDSSEAMEFTGTTKVGGYFASQIRARSQI
jgi:hypothetical protein